MHLAEWAVCTVACLGCGGAVPKSAASAPFTLQEVVSHVFGPAEVRPRALLVVRGDCAACLLDAPRLGTLMAVASSAGAVTAILVPDSSATTQTLIRYLGGSAPIVVDSTLSLAAIVSLRGATPSIVVTTGRGLLVSARGRMAIDTLITRKVHDGW